MRRIQASEGSLVKAVRLRALATDPPSFASTFAREAAFTNAEWDDSAAGDASGQEMATLLAMRGPQPVGIITA